MLRAETLRVAGRTGPVPLCLRVRDICCWGSITTIRRFWRVFVLFLVLGDSCFWVRCVRVRARVLDSWRTLSQILDLGQDTGRFYGVGCVCSCVMGIETWLGRYRRGG